MQILHLDSSILTTDSGSRELTASVVAALRRERPGSSILYRDLTVEPIAHLDGAIASGFRPIGVKESSASVQTEHARSEALVAEFLASQLIVIGAPMYNFAVPTQLKAWIDRIVQPGRTFKYAETGPVGLAGDKQVIVASTRGGVYTGGPLAGLDFQEPYLKAVFGFMGVTKLQFVRAERMSKGPDARSESMAAAHQSISSIVSQALISQALAV
ncbi:FMN-dependent NADH-azoreductase [Bradyrhizobium oligotrophicum S58]|uniref:FMN dependent NADH:quinone oxidoreductase n=1 Tax=Bradyrhizobium oligotrophicum S58 TaxID=1245469 RepID=M4Z3Z0_9BRAD|nr:FMN-dependent NADH-azoreductase [Bradyrhizobium oligotrophicum]BAM87597.1 FMN-dependent NADH-azoreductase [Bradyrhizobium oligotrophicum S58]